MPPKTKAKGKSGKKKDNHSKREMLGAKTEEKLPAVVDEPPTAEKSKDEMWEECVSLQEELERVRKEKNHFEIERDKVLRFSGNSERKLEEAKASMREKLRLKQEAEKCRRAEIDEYQRKLTQLENSHYCEICDLKMAAIAMTSKTHKEHVESEVELQKKIGLLQADMREKESHTEIYIKRLEQKQQNELRELNESYKKKVSEMEVQCENKIKFIFKDNKTKTQTELDEIDDRRRDRTTFITKEYDKAWSDLGNSIKHMHHVGSERKKLEREHEAVKKMDMRLHRRTAAAVQKNKLLTESLQEMEQQLSKSRQELTVQRNAMLKRQKQVNKMIALTLEKKRDVYMKHQQLVLQQEKMEQEYEELQKMQTEAILVMQQKGDLKVLVLEKQIKAVTESLEKEQLKLWVALAFGWGDQTAAKNIKDLCESKHAIISALQDDISQGLMENDLVEKSTALELSVDKWPSAGDINNSIRKASEDSKKFEDLMQELMALFISEDNSVQKDSLELDPAAAESRQ